MRTSKVLALLADAERKHALERAEWASERQHLLDRIMTLADKPPLEPFVVKEVEIDEDIVDPDAFYDLDNFAPVRER